jgi:serine phosphatase RsbU (regulator of sigma subunit)
VIGQLTDSTLARIARIRQQFGQRPLIVYGRSEITDTYRERLSVLCDDYLIHERGGPAAVARSILYFIERERRRLAEAAADSIHQNVAAAGRIQETFFPRTVPGLPGLDTGGTAVPAAPTGGDYFDFLVLPDGCLLAVLADVEGHGLPAALVMFGTRAYLRTLAARSAEVGDLASQLNDLLYSDASLNLYVTGVLVKIDPIRRILEYANAGHPSAYVIGSSGAARVELASLDMPLAINRGLRVRVGEPIDVQPGDIVVMASDGLTEARAADGEWFGTSRLIETVARHAGLPAQELASELIAAVETFSYGVSRRDDVSVVIVKSIPCQVK